MSNEIATDDLNQVDVTTEEMNADETDAGVNTSELPSIRGGGENEDKRSFAGEDDDDDDAHEDEEMDQGEVNEGDEPMEEDDEEIEEVEVHEDEDELEGEEDAEMEQEAANGEVGHADHETQGPAQTEDERKEAELAYSTRGRIPTPETAVELSDHGIRDLFEELGRVREPLGSAASFLDSLTEEERRTRTRFLPDVEGIHQLRKHEVKGDLALARTLVTTAPQTTSTRRSRAKRTRSDEGAMEEDEDDAVDPSEDEKASDNAATKVGSMTIDLRTTTVTVPANAMVAPPPLKNGSGNGDNSESRDTTSVPSSRRWHNQIRSPLVVEAITAFNPPRPPESVGGKKKHRMLRWERRPTDIEDDLNGYRKTVQTTREQLQCAERERERIETVSAHLRRHFLNHIALMNEEWSNLNFEMRMLREECEKATQGLDVEMASPSSHKADHFMADALARLIDLEGQLSTQNVTVPVSELDNPISGLGGVGSSSFVDWDRATKKSNSQLASSWILPGDKVTTPYGEGKVVRFLSASPSDAENTSLGDAKSKTSSPRSAGVEKSTTQENGNRVKNGSEQPDGVKSSALGSAVRTKQSKDADDKAKLRSVISPRICVRLPFGIGYFQIGCVSSRVNPGSYSDAKLAKRWRKMIETSNLVGENLDMEGMANINELAQKYLSNPIDGAEVDAKASATKHRLLPFGACLFPTSVGRGGLLSTETLTRIESGINSALYKARGVLGKPSNEGVPVLVKEWEDLRQEKHTLKAKALQLRNQLLRQRRTRLLNDRTLVATKERCLRIESLATEMRSDLNTLKERLDDELVELGISKEMAEDLLKQYISEMDESMIQEEAANPRERILTEDHGVEEGGSGGPRGGGRTNGRDFSDDEGGSRATKKARVGQ